MSIQVLAPGEPNSIYHWEIEQEDFLVLAGQALLIVVEGAGAAARAVGLRPLPAGDAARVRGGGRSTVRDPRGLVTTVPGEWPVGLLHGRRHRPLPQRLPDQETDGAVAYAQFAPGQPTRYRDGLLPT